MRKSHYLQGSGVVKVERGQRTHGSGLGFFLLLSLPTGRRGLVNGLTYVTDGCSHCLDTAQHGLFAFVVA